MLKCVAQRSGYETVKSRWSKTKHTLSKFCRLYQTRFFVWKANVTRIWLRNLCACVPVMKEVKDTKSKRPNTKKKAARSTQLTNVRGMLLYCRWVAPPAKMLMSKQSDKALLPTLAHTKTEAIERVQ